MANNAGVIRKAWIKQGSTNPLICDDIAVPKSAGPWIAGLQHQAAQHGVHRALSAVDLQVCATAARHGLTVRYASKRAN
jgi:hypothetical protein